MFNADQIEGLPEQYHGKPAEGPRDLGTEADPALVAFFAATGIEIRTSDEPQAYYSPAEDFIHMPPIGTFYSAAGYFSTLAHEATHATGHSSRLDRFTRFADRKALAFEELVAELGNAFLCARLGLVPDFDQSAAYLQSWLRALADDKRLIFKAASEAQKAADFLFSTATEDRAAA
ncbi:ArdC family protein [Paracoccus cavernae]|uniref:ArdC family protein n=1 Tax=Paracoccus cavernae TaxID=1571207 RepID=UPI0036371FAA